MNIFLLIFLGFSTGTIGAFFGIGGGFIMVPILLFLGFSTHKAVGTSLLTIFLTSISAVIMHYKLGNIDVKTSLILGGSGIMGALLGAFLINHVEGTYFKKYFAVLLFFVSLSLFFKK